jgi:hypothetical protein
VFFVSNAFMLKSIWFSVSFVTRTAQPVIITFE